MKPPMTITEPRVAKALSHPLRARILGILEERQASPREISEELDAPLGNVSYHVRALVNLKMIKLVRRRTRRGAIEHYYEALGRAARISDQSWGSTPGIAKQAIIAAALEEIGQDVRIAAETGGFDRQDIHLTRTKLRLDDRGFKELSEAMAKLLERAERIQSDCAKRMGRGDHDGEAEAGLVLMLYEKGAAVAELIASADGVSGSATQQHRGGRRRTVSAGRS
jgi:DNA-binding transcriptional ArsR family regulator